jgi:hypothetical protein
MRMNRPRFPHPRSLAIVLQSLQTAIPVDQAPVAEWRESFNGNPNLRFSAVTNGQPWHVDLYPGHFYRVQIDSLREEVCRSIPYLIAYLVRHLHLQPEQES